MKKRPIVIICIGYIIGILLGVYCESISFFSGKSIQIFCIIIFLIIALINYKNKIIVLFSIGFIISNFITNILIIDYEEIYNMKKQEYIGTIISNKTEKKYKNSYYIKINNRRFILNVKKNVNLEYGDKIVFEGIYEKPKKRTNYKGFDYSKYLKTKKTYGTINLNGKIKTISKKNYFFNYCIYKMKEKISNKINLNFEEKEGGILKAILIGETNDINNQIKEDFSKSSLSHMLAISGTHIGYIVLLITTIIKKYKNKQRVVIIIILIIYMDMIGFTPSVMRACIMNITYFISKLLKRKNDGINSMALSLLLILLSNPFNIFDIGLLLSYGGTIGIIFFYDKIQKFLKKRIKIENKFTSYIINSVAVSTAAQITIFPIILSIFGSISFNFFIFNILAGPVLCVVIFSGIIFVILPFKINFIVKIFIDILISITNLSNILPLSKKYISIPSIFSIILMYIGIIKLKTKYVAKIVILILIIETLSTTTNEMKIYFVDVGQGDCTIIKTVKGKTMLIDGGGSDNNEYDVGKNVVLPYLLNRKISKIDYMIISHFDSDHIGGLFAVLENLKVDTIIIGKQDREYDNCMEFLKLAKSKKVKVISVEAGDVIKIDKYSYFQILWPDSQNMILENGINNNSILAKLVYGEFSMLFTGDIEELAEKEILEKYKNTDILNCNILKVAHHGSKSSSIQVILDKIKPQVAVIGVGADNKYGHPNKDVISRLENLRN